MVAALSLDWLLILVDPIHHKQAAIAGFALCTWIAVQGQWSATVMTSERLQLELQSAVRPAIPHVQWMECIHASDESVL